MTTNLPNKFPPSARCRVGEWAVHVSEVAGGFRLTWDDAARRKCELLAPSLASARFNAEGRTLLLFLQALKHWPEAHQE